MKTSFLFISLFTGIASFSQVQDSVALGAGYMNESYYSLANGEVANVSNTNWDLAFDASAFGFTIRMNRKTDLLFLYPGTTADWATLDTTDHMTWEQYIDGYDSWEQGALNAPAGSAPEDLGWGEYNGITHVTEGTRLFVIKLDDDSYRKLFIETLASGVYTFKYANIDGTNEVTETITKSDYNDKNFIHYSILNEAIVEREPASVEWDIVFTNYVKELAPGYFSGVTGALTNTTYRPLTIAEVNDVPVVEADPITANYVSDIEVIGYDWKTFNMGTFSYTIEDSLCYFLKDDADNIWKLVFTGFVGSSNGKIYFTKEQVTFASIEENKTAPMTAYPVPANDFVNIRTNGTVLETILVFNTAGQLVLTQAVSNESGIITMPVNELQNGLYMLQMVSVNHEVFTQKINVQH